jgi:divalent metal cation (Fe/Co/Zn/Cd) transporter
MSGGRATDEADRARLVERALLLSVASVIWGGLSGGFSLTVGVVDGSLAVVGVGLEVLADLAGSAALVRRFRAERRAGPVEALGAESRARVVVTGALAVTSAVLVAGAAHALLAGSRPSASILSIVGPAVTFAVLLPLAAAKRRVAGALSSSALRGDASMSAIEAATSLLAIGGLALYHSLGWWWVDRVAALVIAAVAAVEAWRTWRAGRDLSAHR